MGRRSLPFLALIVAAAAGFGWLAAGEVERRVAHRLSLSAQAAGWDWLSVAVDGTRVTLRGAAPDLAAAHAALAAAEGAGPRLRVADELTLAQARAVPAAAPRPPWRGALTIARADGALTVAGDAPNAAARAALADALDAADEAPVAMRAAAAAAATPARWAAASAAAAAAAAGLGSGEIRLSPGTLAVAGAPRDAAARAAIEAAAGTLADEGWEVALRLADDAPPAAAVPAPGPEGPWFAGSLRDGRLSLRGRAPDEASRAAARSYAAALFGPERVEDAAVPADGPDAPEGWRGAALDALAALATLDGGAFMVRDGVLSLRGVTQTPAAVARARAALDPARARGWRVESRVTVDLPARAAAAPLSPDACAAALTAAAAEEPLRFEAGAATLDASAGPALDRLAAAFERCGPAVVEIGGHTDDRGSAAANRRLGQARAEAVRAALAARGVDPARMEAHGYGAAEPVADNATEEGRAANRRIAFRPRTTVGAAAGEDAP
jgi:OOP family OmpA-OmpF porin